MWSSRVSWPHWSQVLAEVHCPIEINTGICAYAILPEGNQQRFIQWEAPSHQRSNKLSLLCTVGKKIVSFIKFCNVEYCNADRSTCKLIMHDINTTPKKTKIERACWQFINVRPFHIPRLQLCIPQSAVNAVFKIDEEITKTRTFLRRFHSH